MPSPILPYHVQLILKYIAPPSELENPVPPHLLSRSLYQRHVFLEIEPSNASSYLCWKESAREKVILLLDSLPADFSSESIATAYTADEENAFAHVHIPETGSDGLRLIFDWDAADASWKYHDASLMPFPAGACQSLEGAMSAANLQDESPDDPVSPQSPGGEDEDDSYWNAYGGPDGEGEDAYVKIDATTDHAGDDGEDAYWAQYSSVHGTADSTIPTPPRHHNKHIPAPDAPLPIPPAMMIRPRAGPRDPVSPATLAARLGEISPRASLPPSAAHSIAHSPVSASFHHHSSHLLDSVPHLPRMAEEDITATDEDALSPKQNRERALSEGSNGSRADSLTSGPAKLISPLALKGPSFSGGPEDDSVCEVVRGAYRLWKAVHANAGSRDDFLRLVADATDGL